MKLGVEVGIGPGHIALDWDPIFPPQNGGTAAPHFAAHVYCGQTAGWIKMPLGTEVGPNPGHIVLGGNPAPRHKKGAHPQFSGRVCCGETA